MGATSAKGWVWGWVYKLGLQCPLSPLIPIPGQFTAGDTFDGEGKEVAGTWGQHLRPTIVSVTQFTDGFLVLPCPGLTAFLPWLLLSNQDSLCFAE